MKNKKIKNLVIFVLSILVFVPIVGMAASDDSVLSIKKNLEDKGFFRGSRGMDDIDKSFKMMKNQDNLTEEERESRRVRLEIKKREMDEKFKAMTIEEREAMRVERRLDRDVIAENREKIKEAMEAGNYEAWLELAKDANCPFLSEITAENFAEFAEKHKNMINGNLEEGLRGPGLRMNRNQISL